MGYMKRLLEESWPSFEWTISFLLNGRSCCPRPNGCCMLFCWDDLPKREGGVEERLTVCLTIARR